MTRDDEIQAIVEVGRRTRAPVPRALWIAAAILGGICTMGLGVAFLGEAAPAPTRVERPGAGPRESPDGLGTGLAVGAAGGLVVGFALARQRRDHSSRKRP